MERASIAAYFIEQGFYAGLPFGEIGRAEGFVCAVGKEEVGDLEVAFGPVQRGSFRVDFFAEAQGGFADKIARADIANDGWVDGVAVDHGAVVPHPWLERWVHAFEHEAGQYNIGIGGGQKKTLGFELLDFIPGIAHILTQGGKPDIVRFLGLCEFGEQRMQFCLIDRQKRIH